MSRRRRALWAIWLLVLVGMAGCGATAYWLLQPPYLATPPKVGFKSPSSQARLSVNQETPVEAWAYTPDPQAHIARLLFWVDGHLVAQRAEPANPLTALWPWTPAHPGTHTLVVQALDSAGRQGHAYRTVQVAPAADDPDGDGVPQTRDRCPNQAGLPANQGCPQGMPDQDADGVPDAQDSCPQQAGPHQNQGCPQTQPGDADGDGIPDDQDTCPQAPGPESSQGCPLPADIDGDGVPDTDDPCPQEFAPGTGCPAASDADGDGIPDHLDRCPDQPGAWAGLGCPVTDADGDGIPDNQDRCPDQPGPVNTQGCPAPQAHDADGDGVPDAQDACPQNPGPEDNLGCPMADRDGDGVPDDQDRCPDQAGPAPHEGCPRPDRDGDGIPDDQDRCPDQAGPEAYQGCPADDVDGDGIPNTVDQCPDLAGDAAFNGCPDWIAGLDHWQDVVGIPRVCRVVPDVCGLNAPDSDSDGVPDTVDACPQEPGLDFNQGCPLVHLPPDRPQMACARFLPPELCHGMEYRWRSGQWAAWQRDWATMPPEIQEVLGLSGTARETPAGPWGPVELVLEGIGTNTGWVRLYCSVNLADAGWVDLPSEHLVAQNPEHTQWQPDAAYRSVQLEEVAPEGLALRMVCWGWRDATEGEVDLGDVAVVVTADQAASSGPPTLFVYHSVGGEAGHAFSLTLRVCSPSCSPGR